MSQTLSHSKSTSALPAKDQLELDWAVLKKPLLLMIGVIALIGLGYGGALWFYQLKQAELKTIEEELAQLKKVYDNFLEKKILFDSDDYDQFLALKNTQFYFSDKYTLSESDWQIEMEEQLISIQTVINSWYENNEKGVKELEFSYSKPNILQVLAQDEALGQLALYHSSLSLEAEFMHEGYALDLLSRIKLLIPIGILNLKSCQLERLHNSIDLQQTDHPNIRLQCLLHWYVSRTEITG
jgi:hypothetical protein